MKTTRKAMAKLESDSPELQILVDIHRSMAPLIVKRIIDDLNSPENLRLAVFNHLSSFKYEIGNIPLYLEKGGDIPRWDYRSFLNLLEGMIDKAVLPSTQAVNSPDTEVGTTCPVGGYWRAPSSLTSFASKLGPQKLSKNSGPRNKWYISPS